MTKTENIIELMKDLTPSEREYVIGQFSFKTQNTITETVIGVVCHSYGVSVEEIKSNCREQRLVLPRSIISFLLKEIVPGMTLKTIGQAVNRKHMTIIYQVRQIEYEISRGKGLGSRIDALKKEINDIRLNSAIIEAKRVLNTPTIFSYSDIKT